MREIGRQKEEGEGGCAWGNETEGRGLSLLLNREGGGKRER